MTYRIKGSEYKLVNVERCIALTIDSITCVVAKPIDARDNNAVWEIELWGRIEYRIGYKRTTVLSKAAALAFVQQVALSDADDRN